MYQRSQIEEIFGATSVHSEPSTHSIASDACSTEENIPANPSFTENATLGDQTAVPQTTERLADLLQEATQSTERTPPPDTQSESSAQEITRLRNLLAIQERILDSKDDEIADLRSQRAWLRERIERLEEKSDRDQILLLSETQTIRSLIAYQESRKSAVRQFLEWTGLVKADNASTLPSTSSEYHSKAGGSNAGSRTIEVAQAANSD
jgi:hypothetical protein